MRLSYKWLSEFVDLTGVSPEELATRLTAAGLAVDSVEPRNHGVSGVVVGHVLTCERHPNADKLNVCTVDVGGAEALQIVCGAENVAAGVKVPVALVGSRLPGDVQIGKAKLRGVASEGMLCSARELGLETRWLPAHRTNGLFLLPQTSPIGTNVVELLDLDDVVLDVDLTPNRSDCLSLRGFAYEVAALLGRENQFDAVAKSQTSELSSAGPLKIHLETDACSVYAGQVMDATHKSESPLWMQMRLLASGVRPIDCLVDVTNYVMLEWGQPLHAFDADCIEEETIIVRSAAAEEVLVTLDGQTRILDETMTVIADPTKALGLAGVMGGQNSEITSTTRRIVLESAAFHAGNTRRTGQRLGLHSEAQQRFERGVDMAAILPALQRATDLLVSLAGAERDGGPVVVGAMDGNTLSRSIAFSPARCNRLLGANIEPAEMRSIFHRLGFTLTGHDTAGEWSVMVPTRRMDLQIQEDLVEEIGRIHGLDSIPSTLPELWISKEAVHLDHRLRSATRHALAWQGMNEVFTYAFVSEGAANALLLPDHSPLAHPIPLMRPMSEERSHLRTHLLPSLAEVALHNLSHGAAGGQIFEIAHVYLADSLPLLQRPSEPWMLGCLWFGSTPESFSERPRLYDFYDAKGVVESWLTSLGFDQLQFRPADASWLHPGRSAQVLAKGVCLGSFGQLHPWVMRSLRLPHALYGHFDLDKLAAHLPEHRLVSPLPKYPQSRRDVAIIVPEEISAEELLKAAEDAVHARRGEVALRAEVFDVYTGKGVPAGHRSIAMALTLSAEDRTLTEDEIQASVDGVVESLAEKYGAILRGQDSGHASRME